MHQALWILRKDLRAMRWPIAVAWALMAITGVAEAMMPRRHPSIAGTWIVGIPVDLVVWFVAISVVHEDRLVGDRQFWVTRPYSWKSLLLAKGLFIVLLLSLPLLLDQLVVLAVNGLSPARYASQLLWTQAAFAGGMVLTLALAAVTSNIVELLLAVLAGGVALFASMFILAQFRLLTSSPGVAIPLDGVFRGTIALLLLIRANLRQFGKRETLWARVLVAAAFAAWLPFYNIPWGAAFSLISRFSPAVDPSVAILSPDGTREATSSPDVLGLSKHVVLVPIRLTGIPSDTELFSQRARVEWRASDGSTWDSGWDPENQIRDQTMAGDWEWRLLPAKGAPYWLRAGIDAPFYHKHLKEFVHVHVRVAFTLLGHATVTPIQAWDQPRSVGGNDVCSFTTRGSGVTVSCLSPFAVPDLTIMRFQPLPSGNRNEYPIGGGPLRAANPDGFGIWRLERANVESPPEPSAASIEVRQAIGNFQRELDIPAIRLKEFGDR